jgi:hypothetical protein
VQYARVICDTQPYLYCAFEDADGAAAGLYRTPSIAPGAWEYVGFADVRIYDVIEAAYGASLLLIATGDSSKTYRSTDQGATWTACGTSPPGDTGRRMLWDGGTPGRIYCATRGYEQYLSTSTNSGQTWTLIGYSWDGPPGGAVTSLWPGFT